MLKEYVTIKLLVVYFVTIVGAALAITQTDLFAVGGLVASVLAGRLLPFSLPWEK